MKVLNQDIHDMYAAYHADCIDVVSEMPSDSIHYSIFSPPFSSLYTYSNSDRDMGNCKSEDEFMRQFGFLVEGMFRVMMPGRLVSFHCMNLPTSKTHDGYIGIRDFRGDLIRLFQEHGLSFLSKFFFRTKPVIFDDVSDCFNAGIVRLYPNGFTYQF